MKPVLKIVVFVLLMGEIVLISCNKYSPDNPSSYPPPRFAGGGCSIPAGAQEIGTLNSPDSVSVNELMYNKISWQVNPENYYQVLPLDISAMTSTYTVSSTKVYLEDNEVFRCWTNWSGASGHGMFYTISAGAKTIHIHMDEFDGWALDPRISVSVKVRFQ